MSKLSPSAAVGIALALALTVPFAIDNLYGSLLRPAPATPAIDPGEPTAQPDADPAISQDMLRGVWTRYESRAEGEPLRFWYFHGDGKGLYRYGKVGLANTHSFDYEVEPGRLFVRVRKTGAEHQLDVELGQDERGRTWMRLTNDPYEPGARYYRVDSELDAAELVPDLDLDEQPDDRPGPTSAGLGDRLWIDYQEFATGGAEFHMYQLAKTAIDGRGVGWFHRGDFDDWSTESLTYRLDGDQIELFFDLREEPNVTRFQLRDGKHGRELILSEDPRDFWLTHRYVDGGRSFGGAAGASSASISFAPM